MKNKPGTMNNHKKRPGTMENQPGTMKNRPGTMQVQPGRNKQKRYKQTDRQTEPSYYI